MGFLSGVKYIFQIPLEWFRAVDAMVFGEHPGPGIKFDKSPDGSRAISVDFSELDSRYSGKGGGLVTIDTDQTITGAKVFTKNTYVSGSEDRYFSVMNTATGRVATVGPGGVYFNGESGYSGIYFRSSGGVLLGSIGFNRSGGNIELNTGGGNALLSKDPTDGSSTTSKEVITKGWACRNFIGKPESAGVLVSDASGAVTASNPGTADKDLVLTYKKSASSPSWEKIPEQPAESPDKITNLFSYGSEPSQNTWTAGGETGVEVRVGTRTGWFNGVLYGYYRIHKYDRYGRLYSVGAEVRYEIDIPVAYNP